MLYSICLIKVGEIHLSIIDITSILYEIIVIYIYTVYLCICVYLYIVILHYKVYH